MKPKMQPTTLIESKDDFLEIVKYTIIFALVTTIGSWIILNISSNFDAKIFEKSHAKQLDYESWKDLFKIFFIAPLFETLLIALFFKIFETRLKILNFIFISIVMGLIHEYYRQGAFFALIWVFYVMSYGYHFMLKFGKKIAFISIAIIHSTYNFFVVYFF
jgi:hypothetical protein